MIIEIKSMLNYHDICNTESNERYDKRSQRNAETYYPNALIIYLYYYILTQKCIDLFQLEFAISFVK